MGIGKSDPPPAPDYAGAAREQAQSSREVTEQQTWANRPTQVTPWGRTDWYNQPEWDPTTGTYLNKWGQTTELNPTLQAGLDSQMRLLRDRSQLGESLTDRMQSEYGAAPNFDALPERGGSVDAFSFNPNEVQRNISTEGMQYDLPTADDATRQRVEDAMYGRATSRLDPSFSQREEQLRTQLANQGLQEGDEAYNRAMQNFGRERTDAYNDAAYRSIEGGGAEQSRLFGMQMQGRGQEFGERSQQGAFANQAATTAASLGTQNQQNQTAASGYQNQLRQQEMAEMMQRRGFSLNEINAILSGQQVSMPQMPNFNSAQRSEGLQSLTAAQLTGQADLDRFNAQQQALQGMMSGVTGTVGAFGFSDRRLKRNIQRIGTTSKGYPLYVFDYVWGERSVGVMADEVPSEITRRHPSGYLMVDYSRI